MADDGLGLPADRVASFHELGFALGPRLLDDEAADGVAAEAARMVGDPTHPAYAQVHQGPEQPFLHVPNVRFEHPAVAEVLASPALTALLRSVVDVEAFQLFECHLFSKPPHEHRIRAWHQDTAYLPFRRPYRAVGLWLSLDGAEEGSGSMVMVPGSHRFGPLPPSLTTDLSLAAVQAERPEATVVLRTVPKGHVHLHHPDVWHGSGGNETDRARAAISMFFVERGTVFDGSGPFARFFRGTHGEPLDEGRYPVVGAED